MGNNNNSLVLSSTALVLWSKPKMRKIRTTASFYGRRDEGGRRTRSHTGSSNARSDGARHYALVSAAAYQINTAGALTKTYYCAVGSHWRISCFRHSRLHHGDVCRFSAGTGPGCKFGRQSVTWLPVAKVGHMMASTCAITSLTW